MDNSTNDTYNEYDKYDIIDFMDIDYLEYLSSLPNNIWKQYKNDIEIQLLNVENIKVISFILNKIQVDFYKYITKNFEKINLALLQYMIEINEEKFITKIIHSKFTRGLFQSSILYHDLEFNKYVYENLYKKIFNKNNEINNYAKNINLLENKKNENIFNYFPSNIFCWNNINKDEDEFRTFFVNMIERSMVPKYFNVFEYYIEKLNLDAIIKNCPIQNKINLYNIMYDMYSINSYDKLIKFQNLFEINQHDFLSKIIFSINKSFNNDMLMYKICRCGDIDYFIKVIINFNFEKTYFTNNVVVNMFINAAISKNIDFIIVLYNYLKTNMQINFDINLLSEIVLRIVLRISKEASSSHNEYDVIIYEFLNLGAIIKGYSKYTDYIESIKFLRNEEKNMNKLQK